MAARKLGNKAAAKLRRDIQARITRMYQADPEKMNRLLERLKTMDIDHLVDIKAGASPSREATSRPIVVNLFERSCLICLSLEGECLFETKFKCATREIPLICLVFLVYTHNAAHMPSSSHFPLRNDG